MVCLNAMLTVSLETGAVHADLENSTRSGSASENVPLVMWPGSETVRAASPAVLMTLAVEAAVYSFVGAPATNAPKFAGAPSVSDSVAGTVPPTGASGVTAARAQPL